MKKFCQNNSLYSGDRWHKIAVVEDGEITGGYKNECREKFREYVDLLKAENEIVEVTKEVDWRYEMSAVTRRVYDLHAPAPLFSNIKDCTPGVRVLGAPMGLSCDEKHPLKRLALSLGLPADLSGPAMVDAWSKLADMEPVPLRIVEHGPCKENRFFGEEIDLTRLPVPLIHEGDGGRYINTYGIMIARTPDGSWTNWAITRAMLDGPQTIAGVVIPTQDFGKIYSQWKELGKDMPFALCLGVDPAITMVAGYPLPTGMNEGEMLGAWYGEPVEVVKCETTDLLVPASTEIVIEGFASVDTLIQGGADGRIWRLCVGRTPQTGAMFSGDRHDLPESSHYAPVCGGGADRGESYQLGREYCRGHPACAFQNRSSCERMLYSNGMRGALGGCDR